MLSIEGIGTGVQMELPKLTERAGQLHVMREKSARASVRPLIVPNACCFGVLLNWNEQVVSGLRPARPRFSEMGHAARLLSRRSSHHFRGGEAGTERLLR